MPKKKNPIGAPLKYKPEFCQKIIQYFDGVELKRERVKQSGSTKNGEYEITEEVANEFPTFRGFAKSIGVTHVAVCDWVKRFPEFSNAYNEAKDIQHNFIIQNAICGRYNAPFSIFTMKNISHWRDQPTQTQEDVPEDDLEFVGITTQPGNGKYKRFYG
jgi:hypothetical protein